MINGLGLSSPPPKTTPTVVAAPGKGVFRVRMDERRRKMEERERAYRIGQIQTDNNVSKLLQRRKMRSFHITLDFSS